MDNKESKPQQTGGLKLMTVFIAVLALHVLVIGGFTVYHLMSSGGDADLALDKTHKLKADGTVVTDTSAPRTRRRPTRPWTRRPPPRRPRRRARRHDWYSDSGHALRRRARSEPPATGTSDACCHPR